LLGVESSRQQGSGLGQQPVGRSEILTGCGRQRQWLEEPGRPLESLPVEPFHSRGHCPLRPYFEGHRNDEFGGIASAGPLAGGRLREAEVDYPWLVVDAEQDVGEAQVAMGDQCPVHYGYLAPDAVEEIIVDEGRFQSVESGAVDVLLNK
jgi:hypothetical protein